MDPTLELVSRRMAASVGRGFGPEDARAMLQDVAGLLGEPVAVLGPGPMVRWKHGDWCLSVDASTRPSVTVMDWQVMADQDEETLEMMAPDGAFPFYWVQELADVAVGELVGWESDNWFPAREALLSVLSALPDDLDRLPPAWRPQAPGVGWSTPDRVEILATPEGLHVKGTDADGIKDDVALPGDFPGRSLEQLLNRCASGAFQHDPDDVDEGASGWIIGVTHGYGGAMRDEDANDHPFTFAWLREAIATREGIEVRPRTEERTPLVTALDPKQAAELVARLTEAPDPRQVLVDLGATELDASPREVRMALPGTDWCSAVVTPGGGFSPLVALRLSPAGTSPMGPELMAWGQAFEAELLARTGGHVVASRIGADGRFLRVYDNRVTIRCRPFPGLQDNCVEVDVWAAADEDDWQSEALHDVYW